MTFLCLNMLISSFVCHIWCHASYALTFRRDVAKFSDYCLNQRLSHFVPLDTLFRLHFISNIILALIQPVECMIYIMICHVKYVNLSST